MPELIDARSGLPSVPKPLPTVLILDDEQRSVETLARILQDEFDVHCATTIEEAEAIQHFLIVEANALRVSQQQLEPARNDADNEVDRLIIEEEASNG